MENGECCRKFDPERWDKKTTVWKNKLFLRDTVMQAFHIPLNMGPVVTRMFKNIEDAGVLPATDEFLMLCYEPSPWKSEIYMTVTKDIPGGEMAKISGTFASRVYDGPYSAVPKWIADTDSYLAGQGKKALKYYFHYAYCPKCSKKFGHNYCVAFAQVA